MHVYLLTKVWNQVTGGWDIHTGPYRGAHIPMHLVKRGGVDLWAEIDIHSYADAYKPSDQGMGQEERCLGHLHRSTQGCTYLCATMQWGVRQT